MRELTSVERGLYAGFLSIYIVTPWLYWFMILQMSYFSNNLIFVACVQLIGLLSFFIFVGVRQWVVRMKNKTHEKRRCEFCKMLYWHKHTCPRSKKVVGDPVPDVVNQRLDDIWVAA